MTIRHEVDDLAKVGRFPDEDADEQTIEATQRLLERVAGPVTDDEAQVLATLFGPDGCYGLAWSLLHLIETAPGAANAIYPHTAADEWRCRLTRRVGSKCPHDATE